MVFGWNENGEKVIIDAHAQKFEGITLAYRDLDTLQLELRSLERMEFRGCSIKNASFIDSSLQRAIFTCCDLKGTDFSGCRLDKARFWWCHLEGCIFDGADLSGVDFSCSHLDGIDFQKSTYNEFTVFPSNIITRYQL